MRSEAEAICSVGVATVGARLPEPIRYGEWVIKEREYALVRVEGESGRAGYAFAFTRDGPVAEIVRRLIAPRYVGRSVLDPEAAFEYAWRSNPPTLAAGVGLRALSIVDLAAWDLAGKTAGASVTRLLGGEPAVLPVTGVVGYPPTSGAKDMSAQVAELYQRGCRHFKLPIAPTPDLTRQRLRAVAAAAPEAQVSLDGAWTFTEAGPAVELVRSLGDMHLGWLEDPCPPGDISLLKQLRARVGIPIAFGDEQAESWFPDLVLLARAVDVVRVDISCMGGVSRLRNVVKRLRAAGLVVAPHVFAHVHSQFFAGLRALDVPIEIAPQGIGVDPFGDSLAKASLAEGKLLPFADEPGFGTLINLAWLDEQFIDDPEGILGDA